VPAAAPRPARQPDPALAPAPEALADTGPGPAPATDPDPALRPAPAPPAAQTGDAPPEAPPPPAALPAQSTAPRRVAKATEQPPAPAQPAAPDRQSGQGAAAPAPAAKGGGAGAEAQATLIADWGGRIRARIDRARRYPAAANGATGTVTLRLTVTPSGQVAGVALRQGSGSAILDQAAIDAVRRAGRLPRAPKGLGDAAYAFNLPIVFTR
jgi:protein TonB